MHSESDFGYLPPGRLLETQTDTEGIKVSSGALRLSKLEACLCSVGFRVRLWARYSYVLVCPERLEDAKVLLSSTVLLYYLDFQIWAWLFCFSILFQPYHLEDRYSSAILITDIGFCHHWLLFF